MTTPDLGIPDARRDEVVQVLNTLLADEYLLYTKTRGYHWNVVGPQFDQLHKLFQAQYEQLDEFVDAVAERARTLGGRALGSLDELRRGARLAEQPGERPRAHQMLANLLADHEAIVRTLRDDVTRVQEQLGDVGTADFLTGLMESHEKTAWMLRAFLED